MAFVTALALDELAEATPARVEVEGVPVCLVRTGDRVRALHDVCSHQRWSLADGAVYGDGVECSLHGSTFDLDTGAPSSLPATKPGPDVRDARHRRRRRGGRAVATNGATARPDH
jgi:3-phenylpropionate/trans-cinnamate dioxygenase ferredoxin component